MAVRLNTTSHAVNWLNWARGWNRSTAVVMLLVAHKLLVLLVAHKQLSVELVDTGYDDGIRPRCPVEEK